MRIDPPDDRGAGGIAETVRAHLAMQAQDAASGLWSVGVRTGATRAEVEQAVMDRQITRSWPMRGTLHLMATEDVRWMCRLLNPPDSNAHRARWAQLGLTDTDLGTARDALTSALVGGAALSRPAAVDLLRSKGIDPSGQRAYHLIGRLCQEGLLCQGPPEGRQPTFVLIDDWVPRSRAPARQEAMGILASRYVRSHGPVTERDLAGWTGLGLRFAREAVCLAGDRIIEERIGDEVFLIHADAPTPRERPDLRLLPGFDEFLLGYKNRSAPLTPEEERRVVPGGNGMFRSTVIDRGLVVGTWTRKVTTKRVELTFMPFSAFNQRQREDLDRASAAYGRFLGLPHQVTIAQ